MNCIAHVKLQLKPQFKSFYPLDGIDRLEFDLSASSSLYTTVQLTPYMFTY